MTKEKPSIWADYQSQIEQKNKLEASFKQYERAFHTAKLNFEKTIGAFRKELATIPLGVAIENWLSEIPDPVEDLKQYKDDMLAIMQVGVLKVVDDRGRPRTINDLTEAEHYEILEEIRCMPGYSVAQKQKMVETYVVFSQHLSRETCGLIRQAEDSDLFRTLKRVVRFRDFLQFVEYLSERDALIAKLMYFGAPTLEGVLNLRVNQVNVKEREVEYEQFTARYPKHVILDLKKHLSKKGKDDLVFVNHRGQSVERTHINNCFGRACRKLGMSKKITPRDLMRSDIAKSVAKEYLYSSDPRTRHLRESV